MKRTTMRMLSILMIMLAVTACSSRAVYENVQLNKRVECSKLPPARYDECMRGMDKSYDEYADQVDQYRKEREDELKARRKEQAEEAGNIGDSDGD